MHRKNTSVEKDFNDKEKDNKSNANLTTVLFIQSLNNNPPPALALVPVNPNDEYAEYDAIREGQNRNYINLNFDEQKDQAFENYNREQKNEWFENDNNEFIKEIFENHHDDLVNEGYENYLHDYRMDAYYDLAPIIDANKNENDDGLPKPIMGRKN